MSGNDVQQTFGNKLFKIDLKSTNSVLRFRQGNQVFPNFMFKEGPKINTIWNQRVTFVFNKLLTIRKKKIYNVKGEHCILF